MGTYNFFIVELEPQYVKFMRFDEKSYIKVEPELYAYKMDEFIKEYGGIRQGHMWNFCQFLKEKGYNAEEIDIAWVDGRSGKSSK